MKYFPKCDPRKLSRVEYEQCARRTSNASYILKGHKPAASIGVDTKQDPDQVIEQNGVK